MGRMGFALMKRNLWDGITLLILCWYAVLMVYINLRIWLEGEAILTEPSLAVRWIEFLLSVAVFGFVLGRIAGWLRGVKRAKQVL